MDPQQSVWFRDFQRMDSEKSNAVSMDSVDGIPVTDGIGKVIDWGTPEGWQAFKRANGSYPFGPQKDGGVISPMNGTDAPAWAKALMGGHLTPAEQLG